MNDNVSNVLGGLFLAVNVSAVSEWVSVICAITTIAVLLYRLICDIVRSLEDGKIDDKEQEKIDEDIEDIVTNNTIKPSSKEEHKSDEP